jgi:glycosyltransferase involved in cell wall biosynthesis
MLSSADRAVVMSERHLDEFARCGDRARVIHNAVIDLPARDSACDESAVALAAESARPVVGVVGRLSPEKGVDLFLDACAQLVREGLNFTALVAGDGPEERALKERCAALDLDAHVRFLGHLHAIHRLYPKLDVLVIPSRSEGLPNVLLEALAAGVRVVSTRVGAVPEVLVDPAAGTMVPAGDTPALADAMREAIVSPPSDRETAARSETVDRFSIARRADAHLALYDEVRGIRGTGRAHVGGVVEDRVVKERR